jgi:hypothetical protein
MALFATTELDAVNTMLAAIGEAKVTTIEDETIEDATMALDTLRQVSREFQTIGWHFNTDYDYPISVDVNFKLPYPTTAVHVDPMDTESYDLVKRGNFLYNREDRTFIFAAGTSVKFKVIWLLDFEDLPQAARVYIMMRATRRFAKNIMGDELTVQYTQQDEQMARAEFIRDEARRADYNMLTSSYSVNRSVARRNSWPV